MTLPILLKQLTGDQKLRILALDYVTSSGFVPPDEWCAIAQAIEFYLKDGGVTRTQTEPCSFPSLIKSE